MGVKENSCSAKLGDQQTYSDIITHAELVNGSLNWRSLGIKHTYNAQVLVQGQIALG